MDIKNCFAASALGGMNFLAKAALNSGFANSVFSSKIACRVINFVTAPEGPLVQVSHSLGALFESIDSKTPSLSECFSWFGYHESVDKSPRPDRNFSLGDMLVKGPVIEELVWRLVFQDVVLRRVPKLIVKKIAPDYAESIDKNLAFRIARVVVSALTFSLNHVDGPILHILSSQCPKEPFELQFTKNIMVRTITNAAFTCAWFECTHNIALPIITHIANNLAYFIAASLF